MVIEITDSEVLNVDPAILRISTKKRNSKKICQKVFSITSLFSICGAGITRKKRRGKIHRTILSHFFQIYKKSERIFKKIKTLKKSKNQGHNYHSLYQYRLIKVFRNHLNQAYLLRIDLKEMI
jgi:hypothetical protein